MVDERLFKATNSLKRMSPIEMALQKVSIRSQENSQQWKIVLKALVIARGRPRHFQTINKEQLPQSSLKNYTQASTRIKLEVFHRAN